MWYFLSRVSGPNPPPSHPFSSPVSDLNNPSEPFIIYEMSHPLWSNYKHSLLYEVNVALHQSLCPADLPCLHVLPSLSTCLTFPVYMSYLPCLHVLPSLSACLNFPVYMSYLPCLHVLPSLSTCLTFPVYMDWTGTRQCQCGSSHPCIHGDSSRCSWRCHPCR